MRLIQVFWCLSLILLNMMSASFAHAQLSVANISEGENAHTEQTITKGDLNGLIETLENEAEREKFIDNLNTLLESDQELKQEEPPAAPPSLSEILGFTSQTKALGEELDVFLEDHDLNSTYLGKVLSTFGAFIILWSVCYAILRLSRALRDYVVPIAERYYMNAGRIRFYNRLLRYFCYFLIMLCFFYLNSLIWNISTEGLTDNSYLVGLIGRLFSILLISIIAVTGWEILSGFIEYVMHKIDGRYSKRMQTLLPIVRNVLLFVFSIMFTLVLLSEIGIDIMPLLAGAGVVGIAVGFGAQTMVKDFLTGFVIIMEDLVQVGDVVTVGGKTGLIEKITIRKIQLRDLDGAVYTVPFSEISVVSNLTKDFSYYLMDVGIAYRENPDEVIGYLKEIDEELREDEEFGSLILEPIHILGVDQFGDSAVVIKARIKTLPIKQWDVGREFNRRMKHKFDKHGIEIPFPHQTIYFGEDKEGRAPPAYVQIEEGKSKKKDSPKAKKPSAKKKSTPKKTGIESTEDAEE